MGPALIAFALVVLGLLAQCLAMNRHHEQVLGGQPSARARWSLRVAGWALLVAGLAMSMATWGTSAGIAAWAGLLTVAAVCIVLALPDRSRER